MPKLRSGEEWAKSLRQDIKTEIGLGWNVCGHKRSDGTLSGSCKLTHRAEDGRRSSVMLPFRWEASSKRQILNRVIAIARALQADPQKELNEVARINSDTIDEQEAALSQPGRSKNKGWEAVLERFLQSKSSCRWKTLRDYHYRLERALELLNQHNPKPRSGLGLMQAYKKVHFLGPNGEEHKPGAQLEAGASGRKKALDDIARFLRFAVDVCGMPKRYLPPDTKQIEELVGFKTVSTTHALTPAIKPDMFVELLDDLLEEGRVREYVAVAIVGYCGIRPSELATLHQVDGQARVVSTKRNTKQMKHPPEARDIFPLEIKGRNHEGARVLQQFFEGKVQLPAALQVQIDRMNPDHPNHINSYSYVGMEFRQMLCVRCKAWKNLKSNPGTEDITPYSLRHGFAWRATYGDTQMSHRATAKLMGHDLVTHQRWYGRWIDAASLKAEVERINSAM